MGTLAWTWWMQPTGDGRRRRRWRADGRGHVGVDLVDAADRRRQTTPQMASRWPISFNATEKRPFWGVSRVFYFAERG